MDDNSKQAPSYQTDQEILDARGIRMTVEEVAGLSTVQYSERVQALHLNEDNLAFLKGLRRRIKNRLASQNSRRRNLEHLRRLARELRAVRACRDDAISERRSLLAQRDTLRDKCQRVRSHVVQILKDRSDTTQVPDIEVEKTKLPESPKMKPDCKTEPKLIEKDRFECSLQRLVQQSVNHLYKGKKISAKTVFINEKTCIVHTSEVNSYGGDDFAAKGEVLNLCVKERKDEGGRKSHGRKQLAPRRIVVSEFYDDVLDLKIKKENQ